MVRSVSRSRGCQRCASRKVKCDQIVPECLQCQRVKKACPGIYDGLFIIQTVARVSKPTSTSSLPAPKIATQLENNGIVFWHQPSPYHLKQNFLLCYFISSFSGSAIDGVHHNSWTTYLFDYIPNSGIVTYAIRAATLAFYGTGNQDKDILHEADHWNLMALQGQRASIARNAAKRTSHPHIPTAEDICTTLMLLYYELIRPSVIGSWLGHLRGLGQMIFLLGPQNCQSGVLHLFFRALRLLMAYYSAWTCTSSFLASQEWATVPFAQAGTTACDDVVTVLLSLPSLIEDSRKTHLPMHRRAGSGFIFEVTLPRLIENMKMSEGHEEQEKYQDHDKWVPASGDFCAAVPLTVWQASSILLIHGGLQQNGFVSNNLLNRSITSYCDLILEFSRSVCRNHTGMINAGSCIQLVFPLEIVIRYSPLESQVSCARGVLNSLGWGDVNVMHEI